MTVEELTLEILAERTLTQFDSKRLIDWAVNVLKLGGESENLYILAGLDFETTEEREEYFWKSVKDLNLRVDKTEDELLERYALSIARKAVNKEINLDHAFSQMLKIVSSSDYDSRYIGFYEIDEDLGYLQYDNFIVYKSGLTLENRQEFILEEFKIFLEMEKLKVPIDERSKSYCQKCNRLNTPITKNKYQLKKPFRYLVWACEFCGSDKLLFSGDHKVKRIIIEENKKSNSQNTHEPR